MQLNDQQISFTFSGKFANVCSRMSDNLPPGQLAPDD